MAIFYDEINLELNTNTAYVVVGAKQGDSARGIIVNLFENGEPYTIPSGAQAQYRIHKPDGSSIWNLATIQNNRVVIELTAASLAASGRGYADVVLVSDSGILSTTSFILLIQARPDVTTNIKNIDEFEIIVNTIENAKNIINESESWAVGTRGGQEPISEDSMEYNTEIITINEEIFRDYFGRHPGQRIVYNFVYKEGRGWFVFDNELIGDLNNCGITVSSGVINFEVIVEDKDPAIENNAKYWSNLAEQSKEESEAWAIGNSEFPETINNNAKYWSDLAEDNKAEAKAWAIGSSDFPETINNNAKYWNETFNDKFIESEEWISGKVYNSLNFVQYDGSTYMSKKDNNSSTPGISSDWMLFAQKGEPGDMTDFSVEAGTGISVPTPTAGTYHYVINHSNAITAGPIGVYKIAYDSQGHITNTGSVVASDVGAMALPSNPNNGNVLMYNNGWDAEPLVNNLYKTFNQLTQNRTFSSDDINKFIWISGNRTISDPVLNFTLPKTTTIFNNAECDIYNLAYTGAVQIIADTGVTMNTPTGQKNTLTIPQFCCAHIKKMSESGWIVTLDNTVDGSQITGTINGEQIDAIGNDKIQYITPAKISGVLDTSQIPDLNASKITAGTLNIDRIGTSAITSAKIADSAIISAKISAGAITSAKIGTSAITSAKIADSAIIGAKISAGAVTWDKTSFGTYRSRQIFVGTASPTSGTGNNGDIYIKYIP